MLLLFIHLNCEENLSHYNFVFLRSDLKKFKATIVYWLRVGRYFVFYGITHICRLSQLALYLYLLHILQESISWSLLCPRFVHTLLQMLHAGNVQMCIDEVLCKVECELSLEQRKFQNISEVNHLIIFSLRCFLLDMFLFLTLISVITDISQNTFYNEKSTHPEGMLRSA